MITNVLNGMLMYLELVCNVVLLWFPQWFTTGVTSWDWVRVSTRSASSTPVKKHIHNLWTRYISRTRTTQHMTHMNANTQRAQKHQRTHTQWHPSTLTLPPTQSHTHTPKPLMVVKSLHGVIAKHWVGVVLTSSPNIPEFKCWTATAIL